MSGRRASGRLTTIHRVPRWDEREAAATAAAAADPLLGRCLYASRLLGSDESLVLPGGGNTSVKRELAGGGRQEVLWIKGTGHSLATVEAASFCPLQLSALRPLLDDRQLDDDAMMRALRLAMLDAAAPAPSIETLAHTALPHRYVFHAHPDAVLAVTSVPGGAAVARRVFGRRFAVVPWAAPGQALARAVGAAAGEARAGELRGMVLLHHGVITFADDAADAWNALRECVDRALATMRTTRRHLPKSRRVRAAEPWTAADREALQREVERLAGRPIFVTLDESPAARALAAIPLVSALVRRGPLMACSVARTKRTAAVVERPADLHAALARFAADYRAYFRRFAAGRALTMRDAAPRVVIAPGAGVFTCAETAAEAAALRDIMRHALPAMLLAEELGGYRPLRARDVFELEYRPAEQAKLAARATDRSSGRRARAPRALKLREAEGAKERRAERSRQRRQRVAAHFQASAALL